jgi:hypothetical protein
VPDYRAYIVGPDGHFIGVHEFAAKDRDEAATVALGYVDGRPVELWEGPEFLGTFTPHPRGRPPFFKRLPRQRAPKA